MSTGDDSGDEPTEQAQEELRPRGPGEHAANTTPEAKGRYLAPDDEEFELGRGGIARVLLLHDTHLDRTVAVKELLRSHSERLQAGKEVRFLREARVTAQLEHPGIVPIYELGHKPDGSLYYTMKQVKGRTFAARLLTAKTLPERLQLIPHFTAICHAMAYAHTRGVVHRDLKPANVMVGEFGETVVLDWGLAKVRGKRDLARADLSRRSSPNLEPVEPTAAGVTLGTPAYMSPEQAAGRIDEVDERSDVWSLGAILFELLAGKMAFQGQDVQQVMALVQEGRVPPVRSVEPQAPVELCDIVDKAMHKDPGKRYPSARELAAELVAFESGGLVAAHSYSSLERLRRFIRRHRVVFLSGAAAAVVVALNVAWSLHRVRQERDAAERFASLMLTEVVETLKPVQGSAPVVERVTRAALDFYGAQTQPEHLTSAQRAEVARASQRLGEVAYGVGQYDVAREHLGLARRLTTPNVDDVPGQLTLVQLDLTEGDLEDELNRRPEASALWNAARKRVEALAARKPDHPEVWHERSRAEDRLGWMAMGEGRVADALKHFKGSNDAELEAVKRDPKNDGYLGGLVYGRVMAARQSLAAGELGVALVELEHGKTEARELMARNPGAEEFRQRAAMAMVWQARAARYAGRPEAEVAEHLAQARTWLRPIETGKDPSVDAVVVLVEALLESGEPAAAVAFAQRNFEGAASPERALQLLAAQVCAGKAADAWKTVAWLDENARQAAHQLSTHALAAAAALSQADAQKANARLAQARALAKEGGVGMLNFPPAKGALPGREDQHAAAARELLARLDALHGAVDAGKLSAALQP